MERPKTARAPALIRLRVFACVLLTGVLLCGCTAREGSWEAQGDLPAAAGDDAPAETEGDQGQGAQSQTEEAVSLIMVYVCGAVERSGVYALAEGSRVIDAVEAAGGMSEEAAGEYLNLAEPVYDGEKVIVPTRDEAADDPFGLAALTQAAGSAAAGLVNINTANAEGLQTLPGIGPAKAQAVINYRELHGPFASIEEITNVSGIGAATYENIHSLITV